MIPLYAITPLIMLYKVCVSFVLSGTQLYIHYTIYFILSGTQLNSCSLVHVHIKSLSKLHEDPISFCLVCLYDGWLLLFYFRDCHRIVTLNGFCPLSNPPPPLFLTDNIKINSIPNQECQRAQLFNILDQTKSNEKYMPFLHYISSFQGTSY